MGVPPPLADALVASRRRQLLEEAEAVRRVAPLRARRRRERRLAARRLVAGLLLRAGAWLDPSGARESAQQWVGLAARRR